MNIFRQVNSKAASENNTGFGTNPSSYGGRFINKDGSANIQKRGMSFFNRISWYHTMLNMSGWKFIVYYLRFLPV